MTWKIHEKQHEIGVVCSVVCMCAPYLGGGCCRGCDGWPANRNTIGYSLTHCSSFRPLCHYDWIRRWKPLYTCRTTSNVTSKMQWECGAVLYYTLQRIITNTCPSIYPEPGTLHTLKTNHPRPAKGRLPGTLRIAIDGPPDVSSWCVL